jgi:hypothetical protein
MENKRNQSKSNRELALEWWDSLPVWGNNSREYFMGTYYSDDNVTLEKIEQIWLKETQKHTKDSMGTAFVSSIESQNTIKPNQKQFKEFNPELFKQYIDKFSDDNKFNMFLVLLKDFKLESSIEFDIMTLVALRHIK